MVREANWDFFKTVLMFFIVFGHICPEDPETWTPVTRIIGLFAIPLFFFISGFFQSRVAGFDALIDRYKRNLFRIVVPMLSWGVLYMILTSFKYFDGFSNFAAILSFYKYTPFYITGFYWFLTALIFCQVFSSLLYLVINYKKKIGIVLLFISFPFFICLPPNLIEHYNFSFIWFFYGLGILYRQFGKNRLQYQYNFTIQFFMAIITIVLLMGIGVHFMPSETFYYKSNLLSETSVSFIIMRYSLYFTVSLIVLFWMHQCYRRFKDKMFMLSLASWGKDTLFIYCSHMIILEFIYKPYILPLLFHENGSIFDRLIEHMIGLILSLILYWVLQFMCVYLKRFKWARSLFMGIK